MLKVARGLVHRSPVPHAGTAYSAAPVAAALSPGSNLIVRVADYGAIGDDASHTILATYGSLALGVALNPTWATVEGLAASDEVDWAAWQAAMNDWANWYVLEADGRYQINKPILEPSGVILNDEDEIVSTDFVGRTIQGIGRFFGGVTITQRTNNVRIITTLEQGAHSITWKGLFLAYLTQQTAADTDAVGFCLDSVSTVHNSGHYFRRFENLWFYQCYDGIATRGTGSSGTWGSSFRDLIFSNTIHTAIQNYSPGAGTGLPSNSYVNIQIHNTQLPGVPTTGPALLLHAGEHWFHGLGIEGWYNTHIQAWGGANIHVLGMHIESAHVTGTDANLFIFADQGTVTIEDLGATWNDQAHTGIFSVLNAFNGVHAILRNAVFDFLSATTGGGVMQVVLPNGHATIAELDNISVKSTSMEQFDGFPTLIGFGYEPYLHCIRGRGFNTSEQRGVVTKTTTYTATYLDDVMLGNAAGGAFTITLPTAANVTGKQFTIKRISASNNVTVDGNAAETIDGATTKILGSQHAFITIVSDGTNWRIVATGGTVT